MITDIVISAALLYLFFKGWLQGLFKTLFGPISLVLGCAIAFIYYQKTQNITNSLLICILGPFALKILISIGLKIWQKAALEKPPVLSLSSRLLGSTFSVLWGGSYLFILLILIGLIPLNIEGLKQIQDDIMMSKSYAMVDQFTKNKIPATSNEIEKVRDLLVNPEKLKRFESTEEFKELIEDERLQDIFSDEKTTEQINNKNYGQLLSNPKIQAVFQDQELLKKMFELNKRIMDENMQDVSEKLNESQPKIIDVE